MRRLYFRCRYGHFISGGCCPIDAWTHEQVNYAASLFSKDPSMGIDAFLKAGIDKELVSRMLIIESLTPPAIEFVTLSIIKSTEE
jgi:hypothetical protein